MSDITLDVVNFNKIIGQEAAKDTYFKTDYDATYVGYLATDGSWIIKKDDGSVRYAYGSSNYDTNWTGRAALTYYRVDQIKWGKWR